MNQNYILGAQLLAAIVPPSMQAETITVPTSVAAVGNQQVDAQETLLTQMKLTTDILATKQPAKVITLGGDCSVSEAPFDYLHGQYPTDFGVIWLDAHPDISDPQTSSHVHEMVVANLLQQGAPAFNEQVQHPLQPEQIFFAGLQYQDLRPMDAAVDTLKIAYATPQQLESSDLIGDWLKQQQIKHLAIHWDLDVLSPDSYRSILPAQPGLDQSQFCAAIGSMTLTSVIQLLTAISAQTEVVGLTIAEHMPWDAINLRNGLARLPIFE
ncbi:arginase family protein [Pediococcus ethanolidurans]|nr:arginase family protein [Pediococcus ethanolidurans]